MVQFTLRGLVPPVFTPLKDDFSLDLDAISPYVDFLAKNNIKGILVNGTTGEGPNFSMEERKKLAVAWMAATKPHGIHVMLMIGGSPMPETLELARWAETQKVGSLLTVPELYFRPTTVERLVQYLERVGQVAPNTPLLYYNFPALTGVQLHMPTLIKEATKRVPTFKGIKFTSNDLSEGTDSVVACSGDQAVFLGADTLWAPALLQGFDSAIGTTFNIVPSLAQEITRAVKNDDIAEARRLQLKLNEFVAILAAEGEWVPTMKAAMELVTGLRVGPPRFPFQSLTQEQKCRIKEAFHNIGVL